MTGCEVTQFQQENIHLTRPYMAETCYSRPGHTLTEMELHCDSNIYVVVFKFMQQGTEVRQRGVKTEHMQKSWWLEAYQSLCYCHRNTLIQCVSFLWSCEMYNNTTNSIRAVQIQQYSTILHQHTYCKKKSLVKSRNITH